MKKTFTTGLKILNTQEKLTAAVIALHHALYYVERHKLGQPECPAPSQYTSYGFGWGIQQTNAADILKEALENASDAADAFRRNTGPGNRNSDILFGIVNDPGR